MTLCAQSSCASSMVHVMPDITPRPCAHHGCFRTTRKRYCEEHEKERANKSWSSHARQKPGESASPYAKREGKKRNPVYSTARWQKLRQMILRQFPTCQAEGCRNLAREVDHVVSLERGGAAFDSNNLQALCTSCHARKTAREYHTKKMGN